MSDIKTTLTEISLGLGLAGYDFSLENILKIKNATEKDFYKIKESIKDKNLFDLFEKFWKVGFEIRQYNKKTYPFETIIEWSGNKKISTGVNAARDLLEHYGPTQFSYSVKNDSNIIFNSSPFRLNNITSGKYIHGAKYGNWYQEIDPISYQELFEACNGYIFTGYKTISEWDKSRKNKEKKKGFSLYVKQKIENDEEIKSKYNEFCLSISTKSADIYEKNLQNIINNNSNELKSIFWNFFRIDSNPYILCGLEKGRPFAVKIMDINTWDKQYKISSIKAIKKIAGQPEILIIFSFIDSNNNVFEFSVRVEIRWSHGKFCGNPEAKVYKNFSYKDLPWNTIII